MGQNLLLVEGDRLTLFDADSKTPVTTQKVDGLPSLDSGLIWAREDGVAYYHESSRGIVFLNRSLRHVFTLELPEDAIGSAWLSPDWSTVYYATTKAIRALDMNSGASRLLKEQGSAWQSISGVFFNGTALRCEAKQTDGSLRISLISAQNGALLQENPQLDTLVGQGDWYFLSPDVTCVPQLIFGKADQEARYLWPKDEITDWWPLAEQGLIVTARNTEEKTVLDCYSMETGLRYAVLYLPEKMEINHVTTNGNGILWFCSGETLYRWNPTCANTVDKNDYTAPIYTRENPNEEGLAQVEAAAQKLEQKYGIHLVFGEDALSVMPWDYTFDTEFIPQAYLKALQVLTDAMANFPDHFFTKAADRTKTGVLTIVLVRGVHGTTEHHTLPSVDGVHYWLKGDPYVALSLSGDLERYFYHEMGHVIDSRVLSTTAAFYEWHTVNPEGFQYDRDYLANQDRQDFQYLQDADRWFIDMYSMSFEVEDRSRIFEYACLPGNEGYFASPNIQVKLKRICDGIRQSFGLKKDPQQFLWEQYLKP